MIDVHQTETVDRTGEVLRKEIEAVVAVHHQVVVGLQIVTRCPENHEMEPEDVAVVQEHHMEMVQIKRRVQVKLHEVAVSLLHILLHFINPMFFSRFMS